MAVGCEHPLPECATGHSPNEDKHWGTIWNKQNLMPPQQFHIETCRPSKKTSTTVVLLHVFICKHSCTHTKHMYSTSICIHPCFCLSIYPSTHLSIRLPTYPSIYSAYQFYLIYPMNLINKIRPFVTYLNI